MKKLLKIGTFLNKSEQKLITGGNFLPGTCSSRYGCASDCSEGDICELHFPGGCIFGQIQNNLCCVTN